MDGLPEIGKRCSLLAKRELGLFLALRENPGPL